LNVAAEAQQEGFRRVGSQVQVLRAREAAAVKQGFGQPKLTRAIIAAATEEGIELQDLRDDKP